MAPDLAQELTDALEAAEAASPVDAVEAVTGKLAAALGTDQVAFLIADLAGRALVRLGRGDSGSAQARRDGDESADTLPFTDPGVTGVVAAQRPEVVSVSARGWRLLAPVSQRGEVIGLLELYLGKEPDAATIDTVARAAHILAFVVIANRRHTDLYEWAQRTTRFELSAEIQRRLLPDSFTCEAGELTLSAWLEPAATIGGDTFDYSLERDTFHLSVTDAMGHGVASALTATLGVGSLRNSRRSGHSIQQQAAAADAAMHADGRHAFATGLLGRVDLGTGVISLVNAGHVPPLLMRGRAVDPIQLPIDLPFGLDQGRGYRCTELALTPGDRLVIVTDGMLERRAADLPLTDLLLATRDLHPREATRHLADKVLEIAGPELADDATVVIVDWHGQDRRERVSHAGADLR